MGERGLYKSFYPTFYFKNSKTAVIVMGVSFKEDKHHTKESASRLAAALNCDVMVRHADGRFRLTDYTDHKERVCRGESQSDELIYLDDEAMLCAVRIVSSGSVAPILAVGLVEIAGITMAMQQP